MKPWFLFLLLAGCHLQPSVRPAPRPEYLKYTFQPPPATWEECVARNRAAVGWTATGVVLGVLGGSSGVSASFFNDNTPRYVTGAISLGLGALTALAGFMASYSAKAYAERCTVNTGGK